MIVAIDGPSGAGKSSIAKLLAAELGFSCLDTGAMYRSVACYALRSDVALENAEALGGIARTKPISFVHEAGNPVYKQVFIDGIDVTSAIRSAEVDHAVSAVSAVPAVREALVEQQRRMGASGDYVIEGRDFGTGVFPDAEVKVFLVASDEERAARRVAQNADRGIGSTDFDEVLAELRRRDSIDSSRATSPLKAADDAVSIDSTSLSMQEVLCRIANLVSAVRNS